MHVVLTHPTLDDLGIVRITDLPQNLSDPIPNFLGQNLVPVLRNPYQVHFQIMNSIG
jgi:hypothetical protein